MTSSTAEFIVREAYADDCEGIIRLITELAVYEKEKPSRVKINAQTLIRDGFADPQSKWFRCLVGTVVESSELKYSAKSTKIIGYALFFPTYSTWNGRTIKIEDLYIQPNYRGKGYGTRLLKKVNEIAISEGCARVHWCVLDWNQPAIDYYKSLGAEYSQEWRVCTLHLPEMKALDNK